MAGTLVYKVLAPRQIVEVLLHRAVGSGDPAAAAKVVRVIEVECGSGVLLVGESVQIGKNAAAGNGQG